VDTVLRDFRYSLRLLVKEPGFTVLAILTLALGIGATTAVFTVVDSVILRPLPYRDPGRLVVALHGPEASAPVSPADYLDYKKDSRAFSGLAAAQAWGVTLGGGDRPERLDGLKVSANLLEVLGVPPLLGRGFREGEDQPGHDQVVVLSYSLWQRHFGGDRSIVGRAIPLDGHPYTVVGVMPPAFRFAPFWQTRAALWVPLSLAERLDDRGGRSLRLFGRLADDVTLQQAQEEMTAIAARLERTYPRTNTGISITVRPLLDKVVAGIRGTLIALMAMVGLVLLIACANVASAMIGRAAARQDEIAVRIALGARPSSIVRQLLTESLTLALAGAAAGLVLAVWGVRWLTLLLPPDSLPRQQEVGFDVRVFAAATLATVAVGVLTGLVPALQTVWRGAGSSGWRRARGATDDAHRTRLRGLIVGAEVALALVLLIGAGLMGRTLIALAAVDSGFRVDHLAVATVSLAGTPHAEPAARYPMYERLRERLSAVPGVTRVSAINHLPLAGDVWTLGYTVDGRPAPPDGARPSAVYRVVTPGYFDTMGLQLIAGRDFSSSDRDGAAPVAVINKAMAERQWPGEDPVGRRIHLPGPGEVQAPITVIGVVSNAVQGDWTSRPTDEVYVALAQRSTEFGLASMTFVLRTAVDPATIAAAVPGAVADLDRGIPVSHTETMESVAADVLWRQRLTAQLTGAFAVIALVLAALGIFAAVAYAVGQRAREFGVRMALGGTPGHVRSIALEDGLRPVVAGAVVGIAAAVAGARFLSGLVYGVGAFDLLSFSAAVAVLLAVSACAAWVPARRASLQDPVAVLREG
jgi:putative ABC transport system permease protein